MTAFVMNIVIALIFAAAVGNSSWGILALGFALGFGLLYGLKSVLRLNGQYFRSLPQSLILGVYFIKELVKSCIIVARDCVARHPKLHPAIVHMPLDVKSDLEIFLVANLISLTPGTLTLDVSPDRKFLVIHSIYAEDPVALVADMKSGMEHRVAEVFR